MSEIILNTNLYSRQIGTYGLNTMIKLSKLNIYIYGQRGLGIEIAKNIILAGPRSVTIFDDKKASINDLTANFYITEKDVEEGKRLDEASIINLSSLNPYVKLSIMKNGKIIDNLHENVVKNKEKYDVVIISEFLPKDEIITINEFCRDNKIGFIYGCAFGINTFCFVDFGNDFTVYEHSSEKSKSYTIKSIIKGNPGIVNLVENLDMTELGNDDYVIFKEIEGMNELNNKEIQIKIIDKNNIKINDNSNFSDYIYGGIMQKVEKSSKINFESFEKKVEEPYNESDGYPNEIDCEKPNTYEILHIGFLGLCKFYEKYNSLPEINNELHAKELIEISKEIFKKKENKEEFWIKGIKEEIQNFEELFEKTIKYLSLWSRIEISPITSFLGGIIAQEIVKYTGKYIPINQWLWCNFSEIIENLDESKIDRSLKGTKYDDQIAIFGNEFQKKLENLNIFMIGAGALGCEFLKSFSCMGISTDKKKKSKITVTDNDNIIESNLNRQFLFRKEDIGKSKSKVAINSITKLNPLFNCQDYQARIGPENEKIFNERFWKKQNFIINAVDNIEARKYIANKSKLYNRILIDSGTTGVKANSQVIIPNITTGYESFKNNNNQNQIPMCTLRYFPSKIEHCIEWARDVFDGAFVNIIRDVKSFLENKDKYFIKLSENIVPSDIINKIKKLIRYITILIQKDYKECIKIALEEYKEKYYDDINIQLENNPPDSLNKDGTRYWSENKRCPNPLPFDVNNELAFIFVESYAKILANSMSIEIISDKKKIKSMILEILSNNLCFMANNTKKNKNKNKYYNYSEKISSSNIEEEKILKNKNYNETKKRSGINIERLNAIKNEIMNFDFWKCNLNNFIKIPEFEKDDDKNGHIDFIYAASNLRATIYKIEKCDKIKTKLIAGKIIPAVASTTAAIVGLVSLQLYTLCQTNEIKYLRNSYLNLSLNSIIFQSPSKFQETNEEIEQINNKKNSIFDFFHKINFNILKINKYN